MRKPTLPSKPAVAVVLSAILAAVILWDMHNRAFREEILLPAIFAIVATWPIWAALSVRPFTERLAALVAAHCCYASTLWLLNGVQPVTLQDLTDGFMVFGGLPSAVLFSVVTYGGFCAIRNPPARPRSLQFSLRALFVATTGIAFLVGGRIYYRSARVFVGDIIYDLDVQAAVLALATTWLVLGSGYATARCALFASIVVGVTVYWMATFNWSGFVLEPSVFAICLVALLLPFRLMGYRLAPRSALRAKVALADPAAR